MKLNTFEDKKVQITTKWNEIVEGIAQYYSKDYNEHEFARKEESLQISYFIFYKSDIKSVKEIKEYSAPYGLIEEWTVEDGQSFIQEVLEGEEEDYKIRLNAYLENHKGE